MDFVKLFKDYNIEYSTRVNRGWVNVKCPHCDDHSFNCGFNPAGDYVHCWRCGGHNIRYTLSILLRISQSKLDEILECYKGRTGLLYELNGKKIPQAKHLELPNDTFTLAERKYLKARNFSPRFLHEKYGVVGGGIAGDWKYRIIIPLYLGGRLVSWTGRSIFDKEKIKQLKIPRYKNLSIEKSVINPKHALFNLDNSNSDTVILTEGAFDVMRLGDDCVCSFGTELTQEQVKVIASKYKKVFVMFDNEEEAQKKARKFGMQLSSMGVEVEVVDAYSDFGVNDGAELNEAQVKKIKKELGLWRI